MPKKTTDRTPTETCLRMLIYLLEHPRPITLTSHAHELEVSKQTVLKFLDRLDLSYFGTLARQKLGREVAFTFEPNLRKIRRTYEQDGCTAARPLTKKSGKSKIYKRNTLWKKRK